MSGLFLVQTAALAGLALASATSKPNVILYVIDDLGFADLSLKDTPTRLGGGKSQDFSTPNIDSLARGGMLFDSYYVNRLCSPTRTSLISSRYAYNTGLAGGVITNGYPVGLRLNETCIAQHMKGIGYQTHAFGKWDVGYHTWDHTPTRRGFDSWLGYYNADEDYITHSCGGGGPHGCKKGLDFRNGTDVLQDTTTYSTLVYTSEAERMINHHDPNKGPFFLYAAYQAVHGPLEAPQKYLDQCNGITETERHIFCGMVLALDEGIGNITRALKEKGLLDNTIIGFTTDNGGQNAVGGNNWPLRGNKATVFEGGVRGQGFIWGGKSTALGAALAENSDISSHLYSGLMHNVDWVPTLYSAGGGDSSQIINKHTLDGLDMWPSMLQAAAGSSSASGPRQDILLHLQGISMGAQEYGPHDKTAALRMGDWKVIVNQVESPCPTTLKNASGLSCLKQASGWVQLHKDESSGLWDSRSFEKPTQSQTCDDRACLFNLKTDPFERKDVSAAYPAVLAKLLARIDDYNRTLVPNQRFPFDMKSCPSNFASNAWTPWLNNTPPAPAPQPPQPISSTKFNAAQCKITGWCSGPQYSGPALQVRILVDGAEVAHATASIHRQIAGDHGFDIQLDRTKMVTGKHTIRAQAMYENNWVDLRGTPICTSNGKVVACASQTEDVQPDTEALISI